MKKFSIIDSVILENSTALLLNCVDIYAVFKIWLVSFCITSNLQNRNHIGHVARVSYINVIMILRCKSNWAIYVYKIDILWNLK